MTFDPAIFGARTVGLIGSCVARDFKELAFRSAERSVYMWRMNTISVVSSAPSELRYDLPLTHDESLTFYSDLNKVDLRKKFADSDILLLDFFAIPIRRGF